jgi:CHAT domain-containing protein/Tfp pilus assembly protein PilF
MPAQSKRLKACYVSFYLFLIIISGHIQTGISQETCDDFGMRLRRACVKDNQSLVDTMINQHRLWVKPVVDKLISDYIYQNLKGDEIVSIEYKETAAKISHTFLDIFEEKSLQIGVDYLENWSIDQLKKKYLADSLFTIGTGLRDDNQQREKAIELYQQAMDVYSEIGDERGVAKVLGGLGYIYWFIDDQTCLAYYQKALGVRKKVDDRQLMGESFNGIGLVHLSFLSDFDRAIKYFDSAVSIRTEIGDWAGLGNTLTYKATSYEMLGQFENAVNFYKRSFEVNEKAGKYPRMAEAMFYSATCLQQLGNYPEALEDLEKALDLYRSLEDTVKMGETLTQMGFVYASVGDYNTAVNKCKEALHLFELANDIWGMAGVYNTLGIILQSAGRIERATTYYQESLNRFEELEDMQSVLGLLNNLGTVCFDLKEYEKAEEYHLRGLTISREIDSKIDELHCLINLANDQNRLGKLDESLSNYELALPISRSMNNPEAQWRILVGIAEIHKLKGDYTRAIKYNEEGFKIIEELRAGMKHEEFKTSYMAQERYAYEDIINMLAGLHEVESNKGYDLLAFQYAQRCKSRAFLDLIAESRASIDNGDGLLDTQPISMEEVQSSCLDSNTVYLEYIVGDTNSYLWVITRNDHNMFKIPDRKTLQEQIETLRFALLNPDQDNLEFLTKAGYVLYNQLIRPAEQYLSDKSNLVILPDGILHYLPFEVLISKDPEMHNEDTYSDLPFLVKKYPISYCQSSSVLRSLVEFQNRQQITQRTNKKLIAFGDPVYEDIIHDAGIPTKKNFSRLEHSSTEVKEIANLFQDGFADIYLRFDATEEIVKSNGLLNKYNYIHFATHGLINEDEPNFSSLVLTQKENSTEDGFLRVYEIFDLEMDADLVVLSACQTGLGKMVRGEGMIGLTRAFIYAGTPSVLVSLWNVSDKSTALLMKMFYEHLVINDLSKLEALRRAQLSMIQDERYSHPFFWAPFILIGAWN